MITANSKYNIALDRYQKKIADAAVEDMVLNMGVHVGTIFQFDVCNIHCNISSIFSTKIFIETTPSQSKPIFNSSGHALGI